MSSNELGRRIKEARLAKKLTQAEVVGDFITRNMLSQIESGAALPSVKTLQYLSKVLEVPMSQLMPEEENNTDSASDYIRLRSSFEQGAYEQLANSPEITGFEDELSAMRALAHLELARSYDYTDIVSLQQAADHAKLASQFAEKGIFSNEAVRSEALLLLAAIAQKLSEKYRGLIGEEMGKI
ncbi:MAG: helix-turn-helix transcriptional regulator [Ruminococcus sp.]|nr:helix-turn-helix transcriptional regulator [Ruminococcus sp.]